MLVVGAPDATLAEIAARLRGTLDENREWLRRRENRVRATRLGLLQRVALARYKFNEDPDRHVTIPILVAEEEADCEDFNSAAHALLETLLAPAWEIESILMPTERHKAHAALRIRKAPKPWAAVDFSVDAGMKPAPDAAAYFDPGVVVISKREVWPT